MHLEALTNTAKELLPYLKNFSDYYLSGGTALALQIGHRVSLDFDFFSDNQIPKTLYTQVKKVLRGNANTRLVVNNSSELTIFANDIKVTFLYYPFPLINSLVTLKGLKLPTVKELAAIKAYTIGRRGEYKYYIDLYFLLNEEHTSLVEILKIARKKYKNDFNDRLFLEQLIYLDDVNEYEVRLLKQDSITKEKLKNFFEEEVKNLRL